MSGRATERLFSYGTLQQDDVQLALFERRLQGRPDALPGFRRTVVRIMEADVVAASGSEVHPIVVRTGDGSGEVPGTLFEITAEELAHADAYETSDYRRIEARLKSGVSAWVYVAAADRPED